MIRRLDERASVAGQILAEHLPALRAGGFAVIVNNRPDGEEPGQPPSSEVEAAARSAGLAYRHIPVSGGFTADQVEAMAAALEEGPALAYCRSGTRSAYLWALARASRGLEPEELIAKAAQAGYDLEPLRPLLLRLRPAS